MAIRIYSFRKLPLRFVLVVPFLLQIFVAVGLTGWLSFCNGQKAIDELAIQLLAEVSDRIDQHLDKYLAIPHQVNQINVRAIELELINTKDLRTFGRYFWQQMRVFKDFGYINFGNPQGDFVGIYRAPDHSLRFDLIEQSYIGQYYGYATDNQGNPTQRIIVDEFDFRVDSWYTDAVKAGYPLWSEIYTWDDDPAIISISASYPIYDQQKNLFGVIGIDLVLSHIGDFLRQLYITPSTKIFILEKNGLLVAASSKEKFYTIKNGEAQRLKAFDSKDPSIKETTRYLTERFGDLKQIKHSQQIPLTIEGQKTFVRVTPWQDEFGLNWLIVAVVPESDFMARINANNRTTILLCLAALGAATVLGIYTSRWIVKPIRRLSAASSAIASGDLDQTVQVKGVKELGVLAQSFNQMAEQLRASFSALEKTNEELENRVEQRTAELKEAKQAADAANLAKSQFLANMSHELRTPLNGVLGYAQILLRSQTMTENEHKGINIINQCGSHLLTLINDILDLSKIEAQKMELYPRNFHFPSFLQSVAEICSIRAEQKKIAFIYQPDAQLPKGIHADEKRLRQVLINLLGNAIKFTHNGGVTFIVKIQKITGESDQAPTYKIRFQVEDTGVGITKEQLDKIFLPFEQAGDSKHRSQGTGLGLAISQKIVSMMGSCIEVTSQPGKGSIFGFDLELPLAADWADTVKAHQGTITGFTGDKRKILIVDDRWENRSVLVNFLEPIGFELVEATNGQEGLEKTAHFHPDLIITDLVMPVMDGFEMIRNIRASQLKDIVVIASSASVFEADQHKSLSVGADEFLPKPVQAENLLEMLRVHLRLEWIYQEKKVKTLNKQELTTNLQSSPPNPQSIVPPLGDVLARLYDLAKKGDLDELQKEVTQLEKFDFKFAPFAQQIVQLAESFQLKALQEFIKHYIDGTDIPALNYTKPMIK